MSTQRQRDAVEKVVKDSKPIAHAMMEVGYKETTAYHNQGSLTDSDIWHKTMEQYYPDHKVEPILAEALEANRSISIMTGTKANGGTVDFIDVPDWSTRMDAIKEIHKVKGKYPKELNNNGNTTVNIINFNGVDEETLRALAETGIGTTSTS